MSFLKSMTGRVSAGIFAAAWMLSSSVPASASWSEMLGDSAHTSYSSDANITAANAPAFGIKWMANLFSTDLGSPVVAYNSTLGKNVVYVGNERADVYAIDAGTGQVLWSTNVGYNDKVRATPMVTPDGSVWIGTNFNATLYKLNGATGAVQCSIKSVDGMPIMGSPMFAAPTGGNPSVFWESIDAATVSGPMVSTNESTCAQQFAFTKYRLAVAGSWTTPAYGVSASGEPLIINGSSDPDSTVYAIDANTGALVWDYNPYNPTTTYDVGDGATISPPGKNGFADGVVYVNNKYGIEYALDLTKGTVLWQYNMYPSTWTGDRNTISSAAFDGSSLAFGYANGVTALNATTGAQLWNFATPAEVGSSPAIIGPSGNEVVAFGDYTGAFRMLSLASGSQLYKYQTNGYIVSSPAVANGTVYIASSDGFLYAFAQGGGTSSAPTTTVSSPASNSTLANPNGSVTITGTSTDSSSVSAVEIAVQSNGQSGPWYNASNGSYGSSPVRNAATLASPGSANTTWSFSLPVPAGGGNYEIFANTVNGSHIVDRGATVSFVVSPSKNEPTIHLSVPDVAPGSSFSASGNAFKPGETVNFTLFGNIVASATVGTTGNVPKTVVKVPSTAAIGPTSLTLTGVTSGKTASGPIYITNAWTQLGYSSDRTSGEPNDTTLDQTINVGKNTILSESWLYSSGAPINTEPAVVDQVAYFGNDAGTLTAVDIQSGGPKWKFKLPSAASIRSSPAVDPKNNVIFGANDGNLYILNSLGAALKTLSLGGNLGSPALDNGNAVIASDTGSVYSIAEPAGTMNWSANTGAPVHDAPAYDAADGFVVVGNDNGVVTAYGSATGTVKWTAPTNGAITAAPVISGSMVYVGSADGNLYAYQLKTGAVSWSFKADSAVTAVSAGSSTEEIGTSAGSVYKISSAGVQMFHSKAPFGNSAIEGVSIALSTTVQTFLSPTGSGNVGALRVSGSTPTLAWSFQTGGNTSAPAAILNGTVYFGSDDGNLYAFSPNGATPMAVVKGAGVTVKVTSAWTCTTQP